MKIVRCVVVLSSLLALCAGAASATPFFTQDPRTLPQGKWRVETHLLLSSSDESLVDGEKVPLIAGEEASSFTFNTRARYGVTDNLTVFVDLPYVSRKLELRDGTDRTNSGLGDLFLLAKYKFYDNRPQKALAAVAVARKLTTGEYENLPPELGLGTGQANWQVVLLGEKGAGPNTWYASGVYVWTGHRADIETNPGNVVALNGAVEHRLGPGPYNLVGEVLWLHQGRSEVAGAEVGASGSTRLDLAGGVQYAPPPKAGRKLVIETELRVPVAESGYVRSFPEYVYYLGAWMVF